MSADFTFASLTTDVKSENIHPIFDQLVSRSEKEKLLGQKGCVLWFTGLSGSGKSTIAKGVERALFQEGRLTMVLDGDNVRTGINNNLGFSEEDRTENIRRIAEVAKLFCDSGIITICCFVSPTIAMRQQARQIVGDGHFFEIFINTPLEECEKRDVKGLYAKARQGLIKDFTGIHQPFEAPEKAEMEVLTAGRSIQESVEQVLAYAQVRIRI